MVNLDLNSVINILSLDEYSKMTIEDRKKIIDNEGLDKEEVFEYMLE
jgi:hypothetical protein